MIPLVAHGIAHFFFVPAKDYDESWSPDIVLIAIATSALSIVSVFTRLNKSRRQVLTQDSKAGILMALTVICLIISVFEYGAFALGNSRHSPVLVSLVVLLCAAGRSLYLETTLARP